MQKALPLGKSGEIQPTLAKAIEKQSEWRIGRLDSGHRIAVYGGEAMAILDPEKYKPDKIR